jgi:hypothetical protein
MAEEPEPVMLTVRGRRFACDRCGATVFTRTGENFACDGCSAVYGSPAERALDPDERERRRQWRASLRSGGQ